MKCKIINCTRKTMARGWCLVHYARWRKHGDPTKLVNLVNIGQFCIAPNCLNKAKVKARCAMHHARFINHSSFEKQIPMLGKEHKTTKKSTKSPTLLDIAWASGFYEGDGGCYRSNTARTERVTIYQVKIESLQKMLKLFGGNLYKVDRKYKRTDGINSKDGYKWAISGSRARGFMMTIFTFLSKHKKLQIKNSMRIKNV